MDYYVWFSAQQGEEIRHGYLILTVQPTKPIMGRALADIMQGEVGQNFNLDQPIALSWRELTQADYERERGIDIRALGPADFTNVDQKDKMN